MRAAGRHVSGVEEQERFAIGRHVARGDHAEAAAVIGSGGNDKVVAAGHAQAILPRQHRPAHALVAQVVEDAARIECLALRRIAQIGQSEPLFGKEAVHRRSPILGNPSGGVVTRL